MTVINKRINLCGAQGVGKTTLLEALKKDPSFKGWAFYPELVRDMLKKGEVTINENGTAQSQHKIFEAYDKLLDKTLEQPSMCDRCIVDVAAYTSVLFDNCSEEIEEYQNLSLEEFEERKRIIQRTKDLELIIYLPIEFPLVDDGVRSSDEEFQKDVDRKIVQFLNNYKISHVIITGTVEERVEKIKEVIFSSN